MESKQSWGSKLGRAFRNFIVFLVFVALAGAALYGLSLVNARTYRLEPEGRVLFVKKGKMLPVGDDPYYPDDPGRAAAYAPIELGSANLGVAKQEFTERDELDRAIFAVVAALAKPLVASDDPKQLETAAALLTRAALLRGITVEQQSTLEHMKGELAFFLSQTRLESAARNVDDALEELKRAAATDNRHRTVAAAMVPAVEPQLRLLQATLRRTVTVGKGNDDIAATGLAAKVQQALGAADGGSTP